MEILTRFVFGVLGTPMYRYLLKVKMGCEGLVRQVVGLVKAPVVGFMPECPPSHLYYPPNQFWPGAAECLHLVTHLAYLRGS